MERTKLLSLAVIGLLLLNIGTIGYLMLRGGHPPHSDRPPGPPDSLEEGPARIIIERLQLDDTQTRLYHELIKEHRQQTRQLNDQSAGLYRAYYRLLEAPRPDTTQAAALSRQIANNQRTLAQVNFRHFAQLKALCRPDQLPAFTALLNDLTDLFNRPPHPPRPQP